MSRNRATALTINSVRTISKVHPSCSNLNSRYNLSHKFNIVTFVKHINTNLLDQINTLTFVNHINTAAETKDFPTVPGNSYGSHTEFKQSPSGFNGESPYFQQNPTNIHRGNPSDHQQNRVGQNRNPNNWFYQNDPRELQPNPNTFYSNNSKDFIQSLSFNSRQITHGSYKEPREILLKPNKFQQESNSELQRIQNGYYRQSIGEFQQNPNGHFSENTRQFQQNPNGYYRESVSSFQQNPDEFQRGVSNVHSQSANNVKSEGENIETEGTSQYRGTIDEMDTFCKEWKVKEAVEVLGLLEKQGISVDWPRYLQLMQVCGEAEATREAKAIHNHLMRLNPRMEVSVQNRILEMYLKCGSIFDVYELFERMPERNLTSWDTMIIGLTKNGLGEDAIDLFTQFKEAGLRPDAQMFLGVFSACSALCDINEGLLHFDSMNKVYGIVPSRDVYVGVVNMLGSTGYLDEAMEFIEKMPFEPSVDVWETLMNLCRIHGNLELGDHCAELVDLLDSSRLTDQSKVGLVPVRALDLEKEKPKKKNFLEVRTMVRQYKAGDTSYPEKDTIYPLLKRLSAQMKEAGYVPETRTVLHDVDQEIKEEALLAHSERLAVAHHLINSSARSPVRVMKNLRFCLDCHNALKIMSKLVGRVFIIRDNKRFHHFKDGLCSCNDYW